MASSADSVRVFDRLERMVAMVNRAARLFAAIAGEPGDGLGEPSDSMLALERALYVAIQDALDISAMLLRMSGCAVPPTYREIIEELEGQGIVASDQVPGLLGMAGFRNVLAHEYASVDPARLLGYEAHLGDFEAFARSVVGYLVGEGTDAPPRASNR